MDMLAEVVDTGAWFATLAPWLRPLLAATLAVLLAEAVYIVGARLVTRAVAALPAASAVVRAIRPAARWLLPLVALPIVWHGLADDLPGLATVQRLTGMATIACVTWLLVRAVGGYGQAVIDVHPVMVADNLEARRVHTQTRILVRTASGVIALAGVAMMLMAIPAVRQIGASLLASAGVIGLIAGFAARPVLGNLIAGLQIGLTQPIRLDDVVIVEGEWGVIEEIGSSYVVVRIWDDRRLVVPLQYWIEKPFQNWTRRSAELTGAVTLWADYRLPLAPLRAASSSCAGSRMPPMATTGMPAMRTHQARLSSPCGTQGMALVSVGQTGPQAAYQGARARARHSSHRLWLLMPSFRPLAASWARPASPSASRSSWPRCTARCEGSPSSAARRQWSLTTRVAPATRQAASASAADWRSAACHAASGASGVLMRSCTVRTPAATTWRTRSAESTMA